MTLFKRIWLALRGESAQGASEYALLLMVLALAAVATGQRFATNMDHGFTLATRTLATAINACVPPPRRHH